MLLLLLVLAFSVSSLFLLISRHKNPAKKCRLPPGPRGLPIIGNLHQFKFLDPHLHLHELANKYGPLMYMKLGRVPLIVISSAKAAKEALKTNDLAFSGRPQLTGQQKLSYNGVDITFSQYNERWREMKKIAILHLFSLKQVNSFRPTRQDEVSRMINELSRRANSSNVINLSKAIVSLSSSMICRIAFGKRYEETGSEETRFETLLREAQAMAAGFFLADYFPSLGWIDRVSGMVSRVDKISKDFDAFCQDLIDDHLNKNRPESMRRDIVDLLIRLREEQSASVHIDWDIIKALLRNIFSAGTDTSATAITWAMTALMKTPTAMKKAQDEIRCVVGKKGTVDEDDIQKLPYLKAVIKETMRLYPPTPLLVPRQTIEACTLDGYEIEPKTLVFLNAWAIGRDPEYWENPNEFFPDRFLNSSIDYRGQHFGLIPFGSGRRGCPGMALGLATVELALANLVYSFDWNLPPGMKEDDIDTDVYPGITTHKKKPLCLIAKNYICN